MAPLTLPLATARAPVPLSPGLASASYLDPSCPSSKCSPGLFSEIHGIPRGGGLAQQAEIPSQPTGPGVQSHGATGPHFLWRRPPYSSWWPRHPRLCLRLPTASSPQHVSPSLVL